MTLAPTEATSETLAARASTTRAAPTLFQIRDEYLADLAMRVSAKYYIGATSRLRIMLAQIGDLPLEKLKTMDVLRFRNALKAKGASHATCNSYTHHTFKAMMRWAYEAGLTTSNPVHGMKRLPQSRECATFRRRALTEKEIPRFLAAAEADDEEFREIEALRGVRRIPQIPLWIGFLETGARWNELRQLTWRDVDFERAVLTLRAENTKSRRTRAIPLRDALLIRLRGLAEFQASVLDHPPQRSGRVFLSPQGLSWAQTSRNPMRIFNRVINRAKIPRVDAEGGKIDIHALRHTFASRLCRAGVGLVHAQNLLGHSDPRLTAAIYTHLDVEDLRRAVQTLPGTTVAADC